MRSYISPYDQRAIAAALFNVLSEQVTPAMIARCRIRTFVLRHSEPLVEVLIPDGKGAWTALEYWPDCPECQQSATGKYFNSIHGCTRCGWSAGGKKNRRETLL